MIKGIQGAKLTASSKRTLKHGDLVIVADRANATVTVGNTVYSAPEARKVAAELPADPQGGGMASKLLEQADWAEGRDL